MEARSLEAFSSDSFSTVEWLNETFSRWRASQEGAGAEGDKRAFARSLSAALDAHARARSDELDETLARAVGGLARAARDSRDVEREARELRRRADELERALRERDADRPLLALRRADALKAKLEAARRELDESDRWTALANALDAAIDKGAPLSCSDLGSLLADANRCLSALRATDDYEDKRLQLEGLHNRLEAVLSPTVVEAFAAQNAEKCKELWSVFALMNRREALSAYRARCEEGALRSRLPSTRVDFTPASLRDLHASLLRHAAHQFEWAPVACPGEHTLPWLIRLYGSLLAELADDRRYEEIEAKSDTGSSQLDRLGELLAACDHFVAEMAVVLEGEQEKRGSVSEVELEEFADIVYAPVRAGLKRLSRSIVSAMSDDLGPPPTVDPRSTDAGTAFQLRVARGSRSLTSRIGQAKVLSRGSAPQHLQYAVKWLIDELCAGWISVDNLGGCLSLMKASTHMKQLTVLADSLLTNGDNNEEFHLHSKVKIPEAFQNWRKLLKTDFTPMVSTLPLTAAPDKLYAELKQKALNLVMAPIATHLDSINAIKGWSDNDQHALDLPDFSLSPQEYITQVGQYLMNLPQHLEPLMYRGDEQKTLESDPAYLFLNEVCNSACDMFASKLGSIKNMDSLGVRKCATDIAYLSSVLEELDAGSVGIQHLNALMKKKTLQN